MDKQEIINILQEARVSHTLLLNDGQILIDGINLDKLEEPIKVEECDFSQWYKAHVSSICAFPWFKDLAETHKSVHDKFSVLFYESMRKYNPKTFDQLLERYDALKSDAEIFNNKITEIEQELNDLSENDFQAYVQKSAEEAETAMKKIDINEFEEEPLESKKSSTSEKPDDFNNTKTDIDFESEENADTESFQHTNNTTVDEQFSNVIAESDYPTKDDEPTLTSKMTESTNKHISLKEQSLVQLQQKKELSELELVHLENTQKLTLQSVEQLDQNYSLKQQEIELDQKDNDRLLVFKTDTRKEALSKLGEIEETTDGLKHDIEKLENKILEAQLKQDTDKSSISIAKQFEELKHNKQKDLNTLQKHLNLRNVDLKQLKEQLQLVEEEIAEMENDISKKQQDMSDLEEKEILKNEQLMQQQAEHQKIEQERQATINDRQTKLDVLLKHHQQKKKDLEVIDFQIDELHKNNAQIEKTHSIELSDLKQQQQVKQDKLDEIDELKASKQQEIDEINKSIDAAEAILAELKSSSDVEEQSLMTAD